jgi:hypothetical protein
MSYELHLRFDPQIEAKAFLGYFARRKHYAPNGTTLLYQNADTGVAFSVRYGIRKSAFSSPKVVEAHIEISYCRPSFFCLEAEIEMSALMTEFAPKIEDPQIGGMGNGSYSKEGFIGAWNKGNSLALHTIASRQPTQKLPTMAGERLRAAWEWNYKRHELVAGANDEQFVPGIMMLNIGGVPSLAVVWGLGMPIWLPRVDYVLVGREEGGVRQCGLSPWTEVVSVVLGAGIDIERNPLDIKYTVTPDPIAKWVAEIPAVDLSLLPRLSFDEVVDLEAVE